VLLPELRRLLVECVDLCLQAPLDQERLLEKNDILTAELA